MSKKRKVEVLIPYNQPTNDGDIYAPGCFKAKLGAGIKILESHRGADGVTVITEAEITEVSIIHGPVAHNKKV